VVAQVREQHRGASDPRQRAGTHRGEIMRDRGSRRGREQRASAVTRPRPRYPPSVTSTRRFCDRPWVVSFSATGSEEP
jgi:hypothetical protein